MVSKWPCEPQITLQTGLAPPITVSEAVRLPVPKGPAQNGYKLKSKQPITQIQLATTVNRRLLIFVPPPLTFLVRRINN